jgi:hypothetical protein
LVIAKKSAKKETAAPVIDLPQARVKIVEATHYDKPYEVTSNAGVTYSVDPNVNCLIEVVDDFAKGDYDGMRFYDSFKLKQDEDGDWTIRDGTKLAALAKARYGHDFFESDIVFDENDLVDFEFMARIEPKKNRNTGQITGSMLSWETIMGIPRTKKQKTMASQEHTYTQPDDSEEDFNSIPF